MVGHEAMRGGAGALAIAAASALGKYEAASAAVSASEATNISNTIRKLNLTMAITSWKQFADFFNRSGL
jgi:hypothetical protein